VLRNVIDCADSGVWEIGLCLAVVKDIVLFHAIDQNVTGDLQELGCFAFAPGLMLGGGKNGTEGVAKTDQAAASKEPTTWSCSMHPQIKLPKPGKRLICF